MKRFIVLLVLLMVVCASVIGGSTPTKQTSGERNTRAASPNSGSIESSWPMFHHDNIHTGVTNGTAPRTNHVEWSSSAGFWLESSPAVADGKVFIGSEDSFVYCFDAFTGVELWTFHTSQPIVCSPAVTDGKVYIGSSNNHVYCLDENTGQCLWDYSTGWAIFQSSPAVNRGKLYIGSHDYKLYCLDANRGTKLWDFTSGYYISSSPAVVADRVYFGGFDGNVYCLNANTGEELWSSPIVYTIWTSSPTIYQTRLYIGALDFEVHCLDAMNGLELWTFPTGDFVTGTAAAYEGNIYIGSWDNTFYCLNATTGAVVWTFLTGGPVSDSAAICDGKVYFGSSDNNTYCLDVETGEELWEYTTGGQILSSPAIAEGNVYIGSLDTNVYCFGGYQNQQPTADFTWTPSDPAPGQAILFNASSSYDPDGYLTLYAWDWNNDGIYDESSYTPTTVHTWLTPGTYPVTLQVTDNGSATGTTTKTVIVQNQPPNPPVIDGATSGKRGQSYNYSIKTTDPNGDEVYYYIDWGDGTNSSWIGPFQSGDAVIKAHAWSTKGTYIIRAKAKDVYGNESVWGILQVTMPLSYEPSCLRLIMWLLERFPHAFPILRHILDNHNFY